METFNKSAETHYCVSRKTEMLISMDPEAIHSSFITSLQKYAKVMMTSWII